MSLIQSLFQQEEETEKRLNEELKEKKALEDSLDEANAQIRSLKRRIKESEERHKRTKWDLERSINRFSRLEAEFRRNTAEAKKLADDQISAVKERLEVTQERSEILEGANEELLRSNGELRKELNIAEAKLRQYDSQHLKVMREYEAKSEVLSGKLKECEEVLRAANRRDCSVKFLKEDLLTSGRKNFELSDKLRAEKKLRSSIKADILAATKKLEEALLPDLVEESPDDSSKKGQADTNKTKNMGEKHLKDLSGKDAGGAEAAARRTRSKRKEIDVTEAREQSAKKTQNAKTATTVFDKEVGSEEKSKRAVDSSINPYVKLYRLSTDLEKQ